jgi:hypothetical protein
MGQGFRGFLDLPEKVFAWGLSYPPQVEFFYQSEPDLQEIIDLKLLFLKYLHA